jgi:hypothetical protein
MTGPCPYHKPGQDCGHTDKCPIRIVNRVNNCTELTPVQIELIRAWVES